VSDADLRNAERAFAAEPSTNNRFAVWRAKRRAGVVEWARDSGFVVWANGFTYQDSFRSESTQVVVYEVAPGSKCGSHNVTIQWVYWTGEASEDYTYSYNWTLFETDDGRFGSLTTGSTGTCSVCGSDVYAVTLADSLEDAARFGLSDEARALAGVSM
jgi:hypothetical protein